MSWPQTINIYYLTQLLWVSNLKQLSWVGLGSESFTLVQSWCQQGLQSYESLIGAERSTNKVGSTHRPGKLVLAIGRRSQFFTTDLTTGQLGVFTRQKLAMPTVNDLKDRARRQLKILYVLISQVTLRYMLSKPTVKGREIGPHFFDRRVLTYLQTYTLKPPQ